MEFSEKLYNKVKSVEYIKELTKNIAFLTLKIDFVLANSTDPDEILHDAAFYSGHHCLPKNWLSGFFFTVR